MGGSQLRCQTVLVEQVEMKTSELCVGLFWGHVVVFGSDAQYQFLVCSEHACNLDLSVFNMFLNC